MTIPAADGRGPRLAAGLVLFLLTASASTAFAQTVTDERIWSTLTLQERQATPSPWRWSSDLALRSRDGLDAVDVFAVRLTVGYDLTDRSSVWAGYVHSAMFRDPGATVFERRPFQQYLWTGAAAGGALSFRTRLEQRSIEGSSGILWRVRQQVRYSRAISRGSRWTLVGWEEIFLHANANERYDRGLDQNRAFAGIGCAVSAGLRLEAGYLSQFGQSRAGPDRLNHVLSIGAAVVF